MNEVKQIFLKGVNGEIVGAWEETLSKPLIELDSHKKFDDYSVFFIRELSLNELGSFFSSAYRSWDRFGYMGDIIAVKMLKLNNSYMYFLDYIGRLAIVKPGLAVDLIPIIRTKTGDFFVGVKRKYSPGQGLAAFMGGFIDVRGYHLDTAIETIIHEAKEEINLQIEVLSQNDLVDILLGEVAVEVNYQSRLFKGNLSLGGVFPTGDSEKMPTLGLKRVYQTTVYSLLLDMTDSDLDEVKIGKWLKAGDDAAELVIINLNDKDKLKFGLEHHQAIFDYLFGGTPSA